LIWNPNNLSVNTDDFKLSFTHLFSHPTLQILFNPTITQLLLQNADHYVAVIIPCEHGYAGMTLSETQKLSTGPTFPLFGMSSPRDETHCSAMWRDSMTTRRPTAHYRRSQQQELATALVLVGGDSQDARAIHGSSRSAMVHPSAFVLNGLRLVVVATPG